MSQVAEASNAPHPDIHAHRLLIVDFGGQYTQLIARRVRELGVYSEIHPWDMDEAVVRPGRIGTHVFVGLPDEEAREAMLEVMVEGVPLDEDIDIGELAVETEGYSGAELREVDDAHGLGEAGLPVILDAVAELAGPP